MKVLDLPLAKTLYQNDLLADNGLMFHWFLSILNSTYDIHILIRRTSHSMDPVAKFEQSGIGEYTLKDRSGVEWGGDHGDEIIHKIDVWEKS